MSLTPHTVLGFGGGQQQEDAELSADSQSFDLRTDPCYHPIWTNSSHVSRACLALWEQEPSSFIEVVGSQAVNIPFTP